MNVYIFEDCSDLTDSWHSGGGLVVIARDSDHVAELISSDPNIQLSDVDWQEVKIVRAADDAEPAVYVFADAGCC